MDERAKDAQAKADSTSDPLQKQMWQRYAEGYRKAAAQSRQNADAADRRATSATSQPTLSNSGANTSTTEAPADPASSSTLPASQGLTPPQKTATGGGASQGGLCQALVNPPTSKDVNDPDLVCGCVKIYIQNLITEDEPLQAEIDRLAKQSDEVYPGSALYRQYQQGHQILVAGLGLLSKAGNDCQSWDNRADYYAKNKNTTTLESYFAQRAKDFAYSELIRAVKLYWQQYVRRVTLKNLLLGIETKTWNRKGSSWFGNFTYAEAHAHCAEWHTRALQEVEELALRMRSIAQPLQQLAQRFKRELGLWDAFAGRDGWPRKTGSGNQHPISFQEFSDPKLDDQSRLPNGFYEPVLAYHSLRSEFDGPATDYCGVWMAVVTPPVKNVAVMTPYLSGGIFVLDPLESANDVEYFVSGADPKQAP